MSLIILIACRAEMPESTVDPVVGHDPEVGTAEVIITDDVPEDTGDATEDTASEVCDGYELYVIGLSQEAVDQGYVIGVNCFPTRPTLGLLNDANATYSYPFQDVPGIGWNIAAAPEGDVVVEQVYGDVEFHDDFGNWSEAFDSVNELAERVLTYGFTTIRSSDLLWLGGNFPHYSEDGFDIGIGSYGDFAPITVPKGDTGEIWLSIDLRDLPVTTGDSLIVEQFPVITWHADGVPTVMTKEDMNYLPGDNAYTITYE